MPMVPEAAAAMLALCADRRHPYRRLRRFQPRCPWRSGSRIPRRRSSWSATGTFRGAKAVPQKKDADTAREGLPLHREGDRRQKGRGQDRKARLGRRSRPSGGHDEMAKVDDKCEPVWVDAEDPLFILYTSRLHGTAQGRPITPRRGSLLFTAYTHKLAFDVHEKRHLVVHRRYRLGDGPQLRPLRAALQRLHIGHVRGGPQLSSNYSRFWQIVEKYKVTQFYTDPDGHPGHRQRGNPVGGGDRSIVPAHPRFRR